MEFLINWKTGINTITANNGKEFSGLKMVATNLEIDDYVARPYRLQESGSNENLNELIKPYLPKKTDFIKITKDQVRSIKGKLNTRPRKGYGFQNPIFVRNQLLINSEVAFMN